MDKEMKKLLIRVIPAIIVMGILILMINLMINPFREKISTQQEGYSCYEDICVETTLDYFEQCIDMGWEDTGFLSGEHYWLCDGNKVTKTCTQKEKQLTNRSYIGHPVYCEKDALGEQDE